MTSASNPRFYPKKIQEDQAVAGPYHVALFRVALLGGPGSRCRRSTALFDMGDVSRLPSSRSFSVRSPQLGGHLAGLGDPVGMGEDPVCGRACRDPSSRHEETGQTPEWRDQVVRGDSRRTRRTGRPFARREETEMSTKQRRRAKVSTFRVVGLAAALLGFHLQSSAGASEC